MKIIIIAAVAENGVIGNDNKIPWHSSEDFRHFKRTTIGFPLVMGRKTFESIGKPLPGRETFIITGNREFIKPENTNVFFSVDEALEYCNKNSCEKVFIAGGRTVYSETMSIADELLISEMKFTAEGNIFFPEIDENIWKKCEIVFDAEEFTVKSYTKVRADEQD